MSYSGAFHLKVHLDGAGTLILDSIIMFVSCI